MNTTLTLWVTTSKHSVTHKLSLWLFTLCSSITLTAACFFKSLKSTQRQTRALYSIISQDSGGFVVCAAKQPQFNADKEELSQNIETIYVFNKIFQSSERLSWTNTKNGDIRIYSANWSYSSVFLIMHLCFFFFFLRTRWQLLSVQIKFHSIQQLPHLKSTTFKDVGVTQGYLSRREFETDMKLWAVNGFSLLKGHSKES